MTQHNKPVKATRKTRKKTQPAQPPSQSPQATGELTGTSEQPVTPSAQGKKPASKATKKQKLIANPRRLYKQVQATTKAVKGARTGVEFKQKRLAVKTGLAQTGKTVVALRQLRREVGALRDTVALGKGSSVDNKLDYLIGEVEQLKRNGSKVENKLMAEGSLASVAGLTICILLISPIGYGIGIAQRAKHNIINGPFWLRDIVGLVQDQPALAETPTTSTPAKVGDTIAGYQVTSGYGPRESPCPGCSSNHKGVDLGTPIGTPVYAPYSAKVECRYNQASGNIAHIKPVGGDAPEFLALHMHQCWAGKRKSGQLVGTTGNTGNGTGPHLDWRELSQGEYVHPAKEWIAISLTGETTDAQALKETAARLKLDPVELGALISFETAGTFDPNIMGGDGGQYKGLIQFSPDNQARYGTDKQQTFAEQLPAVERYLKDRGFQPGQDIGAAYAAVLTGQATGNRDAEDSNRTSVNKALKEFRPGGAHYENAEKFLGG